MSCRVLSCIIPRARVSQSLLERRRQPRCHHSRPNRARLTHPCRSWFPVSRCQRPNNQAPLIDTPPGVLVFRPLAHGQHPSVVLASPLASFLIMYPRVLACIVSTSSQQHGFRSRQQTAAPVLVGGCWPAAHHAAASSSSPSSLTSPLSSSSFPRPSCPLDPAPAAAAAASSCSSGPSYSPPPPPAPSPSGLESLPVLPV